MLNEETAKYRTYILVWVGLVILTGMTFSVAGRNLGGWTVLIALAIAGTKSGLVLNYFMHLRSEKLSIFQSDHPPGHGRFPRFHPPDLCRPGVSRRCEMIFSGSTGLSGRVVDNVFLYILIICVFLLGLITFLDGLLCDPLPPRKTPQACGY